jgi:hypothetical protein
MAKKTLKAKKSALKPQPKNLARTAPRAKAPTTPIHRFAHPFFTTKPVPERTSVPGVGKRMTDYVQGTLLSIPDPIRTPPVMTLDEIVGKQSAAAIAASGSLTFHAVGDTGHMGGGTEDMQEYVADAMAKDFDINKPDHSPSFFLHLGDVNYYDNTDSGYHEQFYTPYKRYPGKIIAIPGNHDGELFKYDGTSSGQKNTLDAFKRNFVQPVSGVPAAAGSIYRQMVSQPGVYWSLSAPFADIIGLYSNAAENPGFLEGPSIGTKQTDWLGKTLSAIAAQRKKGTRKALFLAVHHPPFSGGGHASSSDMLANIDQICKDSGIMPDVVLAAHSHDYQAYTRYVSFNGKDMEIPFLVAGGGGRGLSPSVPKATGAKNGDHSLDKSLKDYGYLKVTVTASTVTLIFSQVSKGGAVKLFDQISLNLATSKMTRPPLP